MGLCYLSAHLQLGGVCMRCAFVLCAFVLCAFVLCAFVMYAFVMYAFVMYAFVLCACVLCVCVLCACVLCVCVLYAHHRPDCKPWKRIGRCVCVWVCVVCGCMWVGVCVGVCVVVWVCVCVGGCAARVCVLHVIRMTVVGSRQRAVHPERPTWCVHCDCVHCDCVRCECNVYAGQGMRSQHRMAHEHVHPSYSCSSTTTDHQLHRKLKKFTPKPTSYILCIQTNHNYVQPWHVHQTDPDCAVMASVYPKDKAKPQGTTSVGCYYPPPTHP